VILCNCPILNTPARQERIGFAKGERMADMNYIVVVDCGAYGFFTSVSDAESWLRLNWPVAFAQNRTEIYPIVEAK